MLRGGLAGVGARGGLAAIDAPEVASVSFFGFASKDQGGGYTAAATRVHIAGLYSVSGNPLAAVGVHNIQGQGAGQMLYAIPHYFEKKTVINRLVMRTGGTILSNGSPRLRMGVWGDGTLGSGVLAHMDGSPFPATRLGQSDNIAMLPGADKILETTGLTINIPARTYAWIGVVFNADAVTNQHTLAGLRRNALCPIHGCTFDATTPTTISQDALTFSVGFRHAFAYTGTEDLPATFPQSAPALLNGGAAHDTINLPAIGFGRQPG